MSQNSELAAQMNIRKFNPFIKDRDLIRINVNYDWRFGITGFIARQFVVLLIIIFGLIMAIPYIPGPGTLTILLVFFIGSYPGKRHFIAWIRKKRFFRIARYILRNRYRVLMVMPRNKPATS